MRRLPDPQIAVDAFNRDFKVGDEVDYFSYPEAPPQRFKTRTRAQVLSGHTAVVWLEGKSGCVCCRACSKPKVAA